MLSSYISFKSHNSLHDCAIYRNKNVHAEAMYLRAQKKQNVPLRNLFPYNWSSCFQVALTYL